MIRARFWTPGCDKYPNDYRVAEWPPPGPYWCSGYNSDDHPYVIAFVPDEATLLRYWPEAEDIDAEPVESIDYTSRFPRPEWAIKESWWPEGCTTLARGEEPTG